MYHVLDVCAVIKRNPIFRTMNQSFTFRHCESVTIMIFVCIIVVVTAIALYISSIVEMPLAAL